MRMTVFGMGYLGATHAACMAELGHDVLGVDVDPSKIHALSQGQVPFFEPGLSELLVNNIEAGRLRFTTDYTQAADFATVHFIAVGTPQQKHSYAADTSYVLSVIDELVPALSGHHTVLGKSTVPVGTASDITIRARALAERAGRGASVDVAWNPEFLREGRAVRDTLHPDRIVLGVGGETETATETAAETPTADLVREIYARPIEEGSPLLVMDLSTAELVKTSANAFLATKISFINAVADVCELAGADVTQLATALGLDARIGPKFLNAGLGFGGGCLPKDIRAFMARAGELGADQTLTFLREVEAINIRRRDKTVDIIRRRLGGSLIAHRITVLGAAFKPNSDDVRDSPALNVAGQLSLGGAAVTVYDPQAMETARAAFPTLHYADSAEAALEGAEIVLVATEWDEFRQLDPVDVARRVAGVDVGEGPGARRPVVVDARNCLDAEAWIRAGWDYRALGRGQTLAPREG
ncbi:nucleotide sugar dehydrogenase [Corynebacterium sp. zg254]|uniref:UDP-glucose 6-dehydrogenase n=1 Tax=Corynebacterium zhongnanshanii TaxID=2768834 RepID=A0ABQ6VEF9_9CORY|nr:MULTISPECIES: UDP-glucose/GDP-mannose dehydrogenase family protein [Corynebacterium]KAB3522809.1 UDP-glucose/GDP-mannose dehydrogenase family protein [Corynebacterium zhongnanshanii]MCR5914125.1 nucleotide sugar dehydrogenase [Corynebacterium sp. zg254]